MLSYDYDYECEENTVSISTACGRIMIDSAHKAKKMLDKSPTLVKMYIEDMFLKTLGMIKFSQIEGRFEEMIEMLCDSIGISLKYAYDQSNDFFSGKIQEIVGDIVDGKFSIESDHETIEQVLNEIISHENAIDAEFDRCSTYKTFLTQE